MSKSYGSFEMADGTEVSGIRIGLKDKLQLERTAAAKRWDTEKQFYTTGAFLVWHAAKRQGHLPDGMTYEQFVEQCEDIDVDTQGKNDGEADLARA